MHLLLRDEDVPTVASAITAMALQHGLEPADPELAQNILEVAAMLFQPRVLLTPGEDYVLVSGLDSLAIAEPDEVAKLLSAACETEIFAVFPTGNGVRVAIFDEGDREESIEVDLGAAGTATSPELAEIAPTEEVAAALGAGITAVNGVELAERILELFGAPAEARGEPTSLSFRGPDDDE